MTRIVFENRRPIDCNHFDPIGFVDLHGNKGFIMPKGYDVEEFMAWGMELANRGNGYDNFDSPDQMWNWLVGMRAAFVFEDSKQPTNL